MECGAGGGNRTIRAYSFYVTYCKHTNARTAQPAGLRYFGDKLVTRLCAKPLLYYTADQVPFVRGTLAAPTVVFG